MLKEGGVRPVRMVFNKMKELELWQEKLCL